jgi:DNA-directed RNA polymerase subunit RPC12/RpoP
LIDSLYVLEISSGLFRFSRSGPDRFNFRCPYCGDSDKDKTKARGNLKRSIKHPGELSYMCFNCGKQCLFSTILKDHFPDVYRAYALEKFSGIKRDKPEDDFWNESSKIVEMPKFKKKLSPADHFDKMSVLHWSHPARVYCDNRGIEESQLDRIWWTDSFWKTCGAIGTESKIPDRDEGRIVFPLIDPNEGMIGVQGRSIGKSKLRYATIQFKPGQMVYGRERIVSTSATIALEGPFDTFFVHNSVAICGAQNTDESLNGYTWYLDQEPRNQQIVRKMRQLAEKGNKITLMPEKYLERDPNELHLELNLSRSEITELALRHSYQGIEALLKLASWKRCR